MNQGFFGFPGNLRDTTNIKVQEFDISGSFVIPSFAKNIYVLLIGAGGSGGSGARHPSGSTNTGGSGGCGGTMILDIFPVNFFGPPGTTLNVIIGAGGASVAGATANGTNGTAGNIGGQSGILINGKPNPILRVRGGNGGTAGTSGLQTAPSGLTSWRFGLITGTGGVGGTGNSVNFPQGPGATVLPSGSSGLWNWQSNGGCGGGGLNSSNTACTGGAITAGGAFTAQYSPRYTSGNNVRQPGQPNTGTPGDSSFGYTIAGQYSPGLGGVGGGGGASSNGGPGRDGFRGGGGGGGGGALDGFNGGASGAGGDGYCVLIAYG